MNSIGSNGERFGLDDTQGRPFRDVLHIVFWLSICPCKGLNRLMWGQIAEGKDHCGKSDSMVTNEGRAGPIVKTLCICIAKSSGAINSYGQQGSKLAS